MSSTQQEQEDPDLKAGHAPAGQPKTALVISPLRALMLDQLEFLKNHHVKTAAIMKDIPAQSVLVKAGGMRIVQHKHSNEPKPEQPTKEDEEEFGTSPPKADKHHSSLLVSGAQTKGDKDFTAEAIKQFHEKPLPKNDCRPMNKPHNIHQPGKH